MKKIYSALMAVLMMCLIPVTALADIAEPDVIDVVEDSGMSPLVVILIIAAVIIAAVVIIRKKRK